MLIKISLPKIRLTLDNLARQQRKPLGQKLHPHRITSAARMASMRLKRSMELATSRNPRVDMMDITQGTTENGILIIIPHGSPMGSTRPMTRVIPTPLVAGKRPRRSRKRVPSRLLLVLITAQNLSQLMNRCEKAAETNSEIVGCWIRKDRNNKNSS